MNQSFPIPIVKKELLFQFIIITTLFALWGIANDLTTPMVSTFKKVMPELSHTQASLVQFAFYFGYFLMALPAALFIRKYSYKSGIIVGLILYATGGFLILSCSTLPKLHLLSYLSMGNYLWFSLFGNHFKSVNFIPGQ